MSNNGTDSHAPTYFPTRWKSGEPLVVQFEALRQEILHLRASVVRLLAMGITGVPVVIGASLKFDLDPVIYVAPLIVGVFMLMVLFEQNSIMRAGRYIRTEIEPILLSGEIVGWEHYLESEPVNRVADKCFSLAAYATFAIYYIGGTVLAYGRLKIAYGSDVATWISAVYIGGFVVSMYLVVVYFSTGTLRRGERLSEK